MYSINKPPVTIQTKQNNNKTNKTNTLIHPQTNKQRQTRLKTIKFYPKQTPVVSSTSKQSPNTQYNVAYDKTIKQNQHYKQQ